MTMTVDDLTACAGQVESHFRRILDELEVMRSALVDALGRGPATAPAVEAAIGDLVLSLLGGDYHVIGAGFVAARDALTDHPLYLAWWQGDDRRLLADPDGDPATGEGFDYTRRPWFRVPEETGRHHIAGPYVDYICTDEYVLTTTAPVLVDGRFVGVVGADTLVETLETLLLPGLRAAGATLVTAQGRAVVASDPHVVPGSLVSSGSRSIPCGDLPFAVLVP